MLVLYFKEDKHYSLSDLTRYFSEKQEYINVKELLDKLELAKILKHYIPKLDLDNLVDKREDLDRLNTSYYSFKFVGIIIVKEICLIIYPKYIKDIAYDYKYDNNRKFIQILQILDKFHTLTSFENFEEKRLMDNFLSLKIKILKDFLNSGLYSNEQAIVEINGEGSILWEKTINESTAYLIDNSPMYLDLYTQKNVVDESDIIRNIHGVYGKIRVHTIATQKYTTPQEA